MIIPDFNKLIGPQFTEKHFKFHYPEYLNFINTKYPQLKSFQEKLYWEVNGLSEHPKCYCGKETKFEGFRKGYRKYCSRKCMNADPEKKEAVRTTNIKKYGGPAPFSSPDVVAKAEQTWLKNFGYSNPSKNPEMKHRAEQTYIKKYGGIGEASDICREKRRQTMLRKYGVEHSHQCPEILAKVMKTNMERYGVSNPCLLNPATAKPSQYELIIRNWLDELGVEYIVNDRSIITPKELDIYIPSKHIAIEVNGCYWHSDIEKPIKYHVNKFKDCRDKNIQLIQIWEDWMVNKPNIVQSFLKAKLGYCDNVIYARKCDIKEIDYRTANNFLEANHIQGHCSSNYRLGLFYNGQLVAVMCFNKRSALSGPKQISANESELIRFCNLLDYRVVGGASKLLSYYIKKIKPSTITSYSANDISSGQLYKTLGFQSDYKISESYWYIEPGTFKRRHRSIYTRAGIVSKWPEYDINDKTWTEKMVMNVKGYLRIYDSGTTKWVLNF